MQTLAMLDGNNNAADDTTHALYMLQMKICVVSAAVATAQFYFSKTQLQLLRVQAMMRSIALILNPGGNSPSRSLLWRD
jgi:hypothetical protein